jgi:hypothetical protein
MIIEVNGQQVEVDDSFASLPPEQQQAELAHITQAITPKASVEVRGANPEDLINPLTPTIAGAIAGEIAGPIINKGVEAVRKGAPAAGAAFGAPGSTSGAAPGQKYAAKTGYGSGPGYTVQEVVEHQKAQAKPIGSGKISGKIAGNTPMNIDKMMQLEAAQKAEAARRAAALAPTGMMSKMPAPVQAAGRFVGGATQSGVAPWLGRGLAGAGVGFQGADAYNRFQKGDYPGAAISGIGALGSAASFIPHPATRVGGASIGIGAEALNAYLDRLKEKAEQQPVQAPLSAPMPQMAPGGSVLKQLKKMHEVLAKDEGKYLLGTMADRTKATEGFKGGPGFINLHPDYTWAVDAPAVAKKHMEAVERFGGPERTVMAPMLMSREAHKSNRPVFEQIYNDAQQRIKSGEVTLEQVAALNERMRMEKAVDLSKNPGIENPEFLQFANAFNRRGKVADIMGLKKSGIIDLQKHLDSTIDPALREASTGAVGPQTFTMTGYHNAPGIHPGYNIGFTGEKGSDMFEPTPREFLFRDLEGQAMKQMGRPMTDYNYRNILKEHGGIPNQIIDEKLLRSLQELGYATGGLVALESK